MYLLHESLQDTIIVYMIIKALTKPFDEWDACKLGLIDDKGKKLKDAVSSQEREAWNVFTRLMWRLKSILHKFVGGNKWVHYLTVAYLMRESTGCFADEEKFRAPLLEDFNAEIQLKLFQVLEELNKANIIVESSYDIEMKFLQHHKKIINILENSDTFRELEEMVGSGDCAGHTGVIGDSKVNNIPCFHLDNKDDFESFCFGRKVHYRWKKHDKTEKVKEWAKANPKTSFYVKHADNHYLVKR